MRMFASRWLTARATSLAFWIIAVERVGQLYGLCISPCFQVSHLDSQPKKSAGRIHAMAAHDFLIRLQQDVMRIFQRFSLIAKHFP